MTKANSQKNTLLKAAKATAATKVEIQFFFSSLRCFIFFPIAQPKVDKDSDSLAHDLYGQSNLKRPKKHEPVTAPWQKASVVVI